MRGQAEVYPNVRRLKGVVWGCFGVDRGALGERGQPGVNLNVGSQKVARAGASGLIPRLAEYVRSPGCTRNLGIRKAPRYGASVAVSHTPLTLLTHSGVSNPRTAEYLRAKMLSVLPSHN